MLISPIRQAMIDVTIIAGRGIALFGWTCKASIESSSTDRARMTNLAHETPTWKAAITGKSPDHSRLCSQDCNGASRIHDNDDCYHYRASNSGASGVVENVHEWIAKYPGWARERRSDVGCNKEDSNVHCEAKSSIEQDGCNHRPRYNSICIVDFFSHLLITISAIDTQVGIKVCT